MEEIKNYHIVNHRAPYATPEELDYLCELAKTLPAGASVCMLGAGPGVMALAILEGNPRLNMTIIDHDTLQYADAHLRAAGFPDVNLWRMDSAAAAQEWSGGKVDLLIVDADHSYEGVRRDILAWSKLVREGGYIFFHDYDARGTLFEHQEQYPGVMQAVDEFILPEAISRVMAYRIEARVGTAIVLKHE